MGRRRDGRDTERRGEKKKKSTAKKSVKGEKERGASDVFEDFDANDSGYLDYRELRNALDYYGVDVSTDVAKEVLEAYDDTPDGKLDQTEFAVLARDIESQSGNSKTSKPTQAKNSSARVPPRRPGQ